MSDRSNSDETDGNLQNDNNIDKTESKRDIYQRLRKFSTLDGPTILQVDATVIIGVLFFLTLGSFFEEGEVRTALGALTIAIVFPFSASAILVLWANEFLQNEISSFLQAWPPLFKKRRPPQPRPVNEKNYKSMARYSSLANQACLLGFFYFLFALGFIGFYVWYFGDIHPAVQDCGEDPKRYGINETDIWRCSIFSEDGLAKECVENPSQFNRSLSECHEFIPPNNPNE